MSASPVGVGLQVLGADVAAANPIPIQGTMSTPPTAFVDRSGAITTAGAFQAVMAANAARQFARITNTSTSVEYVYEKSGAATQGSAFPLQPGAAYVWDAKVPNGAIQILSATSGATFEAAEG